MKKIEEYVRSIPDFPEPGIIFRDVTSILQDADGLKLAIDSMQDCLKDVDVDVVAGTESRGFIFGMPIVLNPIMAIPFVIANITMAIVTYASTYIGLVPVSIGVEVPWTTPPIISGFLFPSTIC